MSDPLEKVTDRARRLDLEHLRELDGAVRSSEQLRQELSGFKGQKGIYKPRGSPYALWVRQTLRNVYPDKDLRVAPDGSWVYDYSPEGRDGRPQMDLDTNKALLRCMKDQIPVGVIRQIPSVRRKRTYEVRGLGYVTDFDGSHFKIRGEPIDVSDRPVVTSGPFSFEPFDRTFSELAPTLRRIRDQRFKLAIRRIYHERCSLCNVGYHLGSTPLALEAAHVIPVENYGTSKDVRNGLLLCSNHHALFDSFAWTLDEDLRIQVTSDPSFRSSAKINHVLAAEGKRVANLPDDSRDFPDSQAVRFRMALFERNQ
jgi:hypothetical protein